MKKIYFITCLLVLSCAAFGQQTTPSFDGGSGTEKLSKYIASQLSYPEEIKDSITGNLAFVIKFAIDVDGSVVDTEIMQSTHPFFNNEVLKVFNSMPKELWAPALNRGKPIKTQIMYQGVFGHPKTLK